MSKRRRRRGSWRPRRWRRTAWEASGSVTWRRRMVSSAPSAVCAGSTMSPKSRSRFELHAAQTHADFFRRRGRRRCVRRRCVRRIEQRQLRPPFLFLLIEMRAEFRPTALFAGLQLVQIGEDPLPRFPRRAKRLDERPIGLSLAILPPFATPQKHASRSFRRTARSIPQKSASSRGKVFTTSRSRRIRPPQHWTYVRFPRQQSQE